MKKEAEETFQPESSFTMVTKTSCRGLETTPSSENSNGTGYSFIKSFGIFVREAERAGSKDQPRKGELKGYMPCLRSRSNSTTVPELARKLLKNAKPIINKT